MAKKKYYVVWNGVNPGIYDSWTEATLQINGYEAAKYKSFTSEESAIRAYSMGYDTYIKTVKKTPKSNSIAVNKKIIKNSIAVDAACSGNPGDMEYRGVKTISGEELFRLGPFKEATNNIGEFLAIIHAAALLKKNKLNNTIIYTDSKTAMAWVRNKKVKTTLKRTEKNKKVWQLIERAYTWLKNNKIEN
jgi:ribonuclease HI